MDPRTDLCIKNSDSNKIVIGSTRNSGTQLLTTDTRELLYSVSQKHDDRTLL